MRTIVLTCAALFFLYDLGFLGPRYKFKETFTGKCDFIQMRIIRN